MTQLPGRELENYPVLQWIVCEFHYTALSEGEAFTLADDGETIRLGLNAPPRLISFNIHDVGIADPTVTLKLGHDGIVTQEVEIQMGRALVDQMFYASQDEGSPLRIELDGNKR